MTASNPFGLHTVTPYLVVEDVTALIGFLETVFGATLRGDPHHRDDGSVMHAEMVIGDSVVMMGEPTGNVGKASATLYTYVDDCDATFELALASGGTEVMKPADQPHGDRYGGVKDPCGNTWWVTTHIGTSS